MPVYKNEREYHENAGYVDSQDNPLTGVPVVIYRSKDQQMDMEEPLMITKSCCLDFPPEVQATDRITAPFTTSSCLKRYTRVAYTANLTSYFVP